MGDITLTNKQLVALHSKACQNNLSEFVRASMPVVSPGDDYIHNWHIDAICEFLEAIYTGDIKRGIINMPPRMLKSVCASICFPAWILGKDPSAQIMAATYGKQVTEDMSNKTRMLMKSNFYKRVFPDTMIAEEQDQKHFFKTTLGGQRFATAFDSVATGLGGDFLIADDPINAKDSQSAVERQNCIDWFDDTLVSRLNNRKTGRIFVVMQRLHPDDLTGHLEKEGGYEILRLPIYATHQHVVKVLDKEWVMPAETYLHEERIGPKELEELSRKRSFQAQYMQAPELSGDREIDLRKIEYYKANAREDEQLRPENMNIVILVDPANSKKDGSDYTAIMVVGLHVDQNYYLLDMKRDRWNMTERGNAIIEMVRKWHAKSRKLPTGGRAMPTVGIEKYGMMTDGEYLKELQAREDFRFRVVEFGGKTSKDDRIRRMIPDIEDGRWYFPDKFMYRDVKGHQVDLLHELVNKEMGTFPGGVHPDMLDALSRIKDPDMLIYVKFPKERVKQMSQVEFGSSARRSSTSRKRHWLNA